MAVKMSLRPPGSSWRKALRARGRASTAYSLILSVPELGFEFVERDRLAGLIPGGVSLGGVFGVLGGAEGLDHGLRDDGRDTLTGDRQVSDDATARVRHRSAHGLTVGGNITDGLTHSIQRTKAGIGLPARSSTTARSQSPVTIHACDRPPSQRPQGPVPAQRVWVQTKLFEKLL